MKKFEKVRLVIALIRHDPNEQYRKIHKSIGSRDLLNEGDNNKDTPLHLATYNGHTAVVKLLLSKPYLEVNCQNHHSSTPLMITLALESMLVDDFIRLNCCA
jgi:ankyrin repeat protein